MAEKGVHGLSIEEVAVRAGVGKTTIYRRWPSRGTLALDAFQAEFPGPRQMPDTGSLAGDLREALSGWVNATTRSGGGAMIVGLLAEMQQDRDLAKAWQDQVRAPMRAKYSILLDRAVNRGEIADIDAGVVIDMMMGACYYRLKLHTQRGRGTLNEQFINQVVNIIAAGLGARPS